MKIKKKNYTYRRRRSLTMIVITTITKRKMDELIERHTWFFYFKLFFKPFLLRRSMWKWRLEGMHKTRPTSCENIENHFIYICTEPFSVITLVFLHRLTTLAVGGAQTSTGGYSTATCEGFNTFQSLYHELSVSSLGTRRYTNEATT